MARIKNENVDIRSVLLEELKKKSNNQGNTILKQEKANAFSKYESQKLRQVNEFIDLFKKYRDEKLDIEESEFKDKRDEFNDFVNSFLTELEEGINLEKSSTKNDLLLTKIHFAQSLLTRMYIKLNNEKASEAQENLKREKERIEQLKEEFNNLNREFDKQLDEISSTKKELVSIMGLFIGIFSFFQLNFSHISSLDKFDSRGKILFLLVFNVVLLLGIYLTFSLVHYIVHRDFELLSKKITIGNRYSIRVSYAVITASLIIILTSVIFIK